MYVSMYDLYARMHTTARACRILLHAHLVTPLACKIRLALLVVNSVKLHLTAYKINVTSRQKSTWTAFCLQALCQLFERLCNLFLETSAHSNDLLTCLLETSTCLNGLLTPISWKLHPPPTTWSPVRWKPQSIWTAWSPVCC